MTLREILADIHALEEELIDFERSTACVPKPSAPPTSMAKSQKTTIGCWISGSGPVCTAPG